MLVKTDSTQAPIAVLDTVHRTRHEHAVAEKDHQKREEAPLAPDAGMDVTNPGARAGRPMSAWSLQQKLQKIVPNLYFEKSNNDPSKTGVYIQTGRRDIDLYKGSLQFICGMESGIMPEFSVIEAEAKAIPDPTAVGGRRVQLGMAREIRGWRTVLARLLKQRVLSAGDIERYFHIALGRDSAKWQAMLAGAFDVISTTTEITEENHGGDEGKDEGREGVDSPDGNGDRPSDDQSGEWPDDFSASGGNNAGTVDDTRQGTPQAGRRDLGEEGGGSGTAARVDAPNDRLGECGNTGTDKSGGELRP